VNGPSGPVAEAAAAARRGEPIVFPTDTVYGLGTRPDDPSATARIFEAKGRPRDLELPVLVASIEDARSIAAFDDRATRLAAALWPGPLTIVAPRSPASAGWDLGGDPATVGVRIPRHRLALAVLMATGPLAVTSANRSGEPPVTTCEGLRAVLGGSVAVYLCEDRPLEGVASTVVDLAHGPARVLRRGGLPAEAIRELLPDGALLDSPPSP
jgi:L-threonylcarbamoyladenylate synthase